MEKEKISTSSFVFFATTALLTLSFTAYTWHTNTPRKRKTTTTHSPQPPPEEEPQNIKQEEEEEDFGEEIDYATLDYPFDFLDSKRNIEYTEAGVIKAGTIYKLVEKLTVPEESRRGTSQYTSSFLLTYRSFSTPRELLDLLIKRYNVQVEGHVHPNYKKHIQLRVWYVLKEWTDNHFYDFVDDNELIAYYRTFILTRMKKDMEKLAQQLLGILDRQINKSGNLQRKSISYCAPEPIAPSSGIDGRLSIYDIAPLEIARQLTLIEYDLYNKIQPKECLGQAWNKPEKEKNAPHIVALIERFNRLSSWVVNCIVKEEDLTLRAKLVVHLIAIAAECKQLQNYNSMLGIVAGLMSSAVDRLKKTWAIVPMEISEKFASDYSTLFLRNYKVLRDAVKQSTPPCLPYLGVYLADLTFIEDGNPDFMERKSGAIKLINFEKRLMIFKVITNLRIYQSKHYQLAPLPQVQEFLETAIMRDTLSDVNETHKLSLLREPREQ